MKKTMIAMLCGLMFSLAGSAQNKVDTTPFFQNKVFVNASTTSLGLSYDKTQDWRLGVDFSGGYFIDDNIAVTGKLGYDLVTGPDLLTVGVGARYYMEQNGIFFGAGINYKHCDNYDDFMPTIHAGYAFFLNRTVTFEPMVYYNQSLKSHKDYSGFGIQLGFSIYFE